jgi:3-hydroxybutyryl-CoA dehydratase
MASSDGCPHTLQTGDALPRVVKQLSQEKVNRYADAVGDYNPIHVDESFASRSPFGGTIAHGMLILAYMSEMMTLAFGQNWFSGGKLSVRFKAPAHSNDLVTCTGRITTISQTTNGQSYNCDVTCSNQNQDIIIAGEANVAVPLDSGERI